MIVFVGGTIRTMDPDLGVVEALAVRDGRVVAAGTRAEIDALGPPDEVVHLRGRTVLPGFVDGHAHPAEGGALSLDADLSEARSLPALLRAVARHAAAHPEAEWVLGSGWDLPTFAGELELARLDEVVPDRPAFLSASDGHEAYVNSQALALAGIDPSDAPGGMIREAQVDAVAELLPEPSDAQADAGLAAYLALARRAGITTVVDANASEWGLRAYRRTELPVRVHAAVGDVAEAVRLRDAYAGGRLRVDAVKVYVDGVIETGTAALVDPYVDGTHPPPELDRNALAEVLRAADAAGLRFHAHAIGDGAVRAALDAVEEVRPRLAPVLAHLELVHPEDVPRFAALDVTACVQAYWAWPDPWVTELTLPVVGPERGARLYPIGALVRSGARVAGGSDWDVTTMDVLDAIEVAVTRRDPEERSDALAPDQAVTVEDMLRAYTIDGAAALGRDDLGRLVPGALADLVVLDADPVEVAPRRLSRVRVRERWIEGAR